MMRPPLYRFVIATLAPAMLVCGCSAMRTPYEPPSVQLAPAWPHTAEAPPTASTAWWTQYADPVLEALVERALVTNQDLSVAVIRVRRARLNAGLAANDLLPQPGATLSAGASRPLDGAGGTARSYGASATVAYELDLWNRLDAARDAAQWEAAAAAEDWSAARLSLVATTVTLYFQLGYLAQRLEIDAQSLENARRILRLVELQYTTGAVSGLELAEARGNVEVQEATRTQVLQLQVETRNALIALLDGEDVSALALQLPETAALPPVDAGLPAQLLSRRPDLRALDSRLRASLASVDSTHASFFPALTLTGEAGSSSTALRDLLSNPVGALSASLALPFLNVQRVRFTRAIARSQYEEDIATFRQTLRQALAEVDNSLSARMQLREHERRIGAALQYAMDAEQRYEVRYRAGSAPLRDWLTAQETRRTAQAAVLQNRFDQANNHVLLNKALGGDARALPPGLDPPER